MTLDDSRNTNIGDHSRISIDALRNCANHTLRELFVKQAVYVHFTPDPSNPNLLSALRNDLYCVGWGVKLYSLTPPNLLDILSTIVFVHVP